MPVYDIEGPTVIDHPTFGRVVIRGCLLCGFKECVRPANPIRIGKWRGTLCPEHHDRWEAATIAGRKQPGLFVARQLWAAGRLPEAYPTDDSGYGVHPIQSFPISWAKFTWGGRVLRSKHPEVQEPGSEPFFFLAPGPIPVARQVEP